MDDTGSAIITKIGLTIYLTRKKATIAAAKAHLETGASKGAYRVGTRTGAADLNQKVLTLRWSLVTGSKSICSIISRSPRGHTLI